MGKNWNENIAQENYKEWKLYAQYRSGWDKDASRFDDFRYGSHFSQAEEKQLLAFKQAPLPISVTTAICDTAEALMTSSKPIIKVAPIVNPFNERLTDLSKKVSQIYNFLIQKSWYDSLGSLQHDRVVRDYTNVGHGLYYIVPKNEFGQFSVDIKHLPWKYYYPDPQSKDPFYRDADAHIVYMDISEKAAYKFVSRFESDLSFEKFRENYIKPIKFSVRNKGISSKYDPNGINLKNVPFIQRYTIEQQTVYIAIPTNQQINTEEVDVKYRTYTEKSAELIQLEEEGKIRIETETKSYLTEYTSVGALGYKDVFPINSPNIVPLVYDHRDNPYPLGRVWYLYPLQRALNKFIMIAILNGTLMNATRIIAEENSIVNIDEWRTNSSMPGSILRYNLPVPGYSKAPEVITAQPLSDAWLAMPRYLTYIMEYISGIFGTMMGDATNAPDVFSTVATLQSASGQKIKRRQAQADATLSIVGNVVAQFYREYAPLNGYSTLIDQNGEQSQPQVYNRIAVKPNTDGKEIYIDPETDLSIGFNDVRFTTGGSNGYESATEAALLTNIATQLKVKEMVPLVLKRLNIPGVDKIVEQINTVDMQAAQIEQLQAQVKNLDSLSERLANQVTQKAFELSKSQFDTKFTKLLSEIERNGGNGRG